MSVAQKRDFNNCIHWNSVLVGAFQFKIQVEKSLSNFLSLNSSMTAISFSDGFLSTQTPRKRENKKIKFNSFRKLLLNAWQNTMEINFVFYCTMLFSRNDQLTSYCAIEKKLICIKFHHEKVLLFASFLFLSKLTYKCCLRTHNIVYTQTHTPHCTICSSKHMLSGIHFSKEAKN